MRFNFNELIVITHELIAIVTYFTICNNCYNLWTIKTELNVVSYENYTAPSPDRGHPTKGQFAPD